MRRVVAPDIDEGQQGREPAASPFALQPEGCRGRLEAEVQIDAARPRARFRLDVQAQQRQEHVQKTA